MRLSASSPGGREPQVPPLRFAPVGMTILLCPQALQREILDPRNRFVIVPTGSGGTGAKRSGEPALSEVEWGPAVLSASTHTRSKALICGELFGPGEPVPFQVEQLFGGLRLTAGVF